MTPKEKAKELVDKMYMLDDPSGNYPICFDIAKQSALIAVDEILNLDLHSVGDYKFFDDPSEWYISYWEEVKEEIELL